jgi:hypothetical protein
MIVHRNECDARCVIFASTPEFPFEKTYEKLSCRRGDGTNKTVLYEQYYEDKTSPTDFLSAKGNDMLSSNSHDTCP